MRMDPPYALDLPRLGPRQCDSQVLEGRGQSGRKHSRVREPRRISHPLEYAGKGIGYPRRPKTYRGFFASQISFLLDLGP
jgi:hypothetical protein